MPVPTELVRFLLKYSSFPQKKKMGHASEITYSKNSSSWYFVAFSISLVHYNDPKVNIFF